MTSERMKARRLLQAKVRGVSDRDKGIVTLYDSGKWTMYDIACLAGMTYQRVQQIISNSRKAKAK